MRNIIKDLWLAVALILGVSAILLLSDLEQRQTSAPGPVKEYPGIAVMQISSTSLLDKHVQGVLDRLQSEGFIASDESNIRQFNPQADMSTANAIAKDLVNGPYDIIITSSTLALQTIANANKSSRKPHIFGAVTDPYGAGVGITGPAPNHHPAYMSGIGTFQPVEKAFRVLKKMNPGIEKVGVVWNPGEQCSEACLTEARMICAELGITLLEAIATNTSEVSEAARSLLAKGAEAIWIGGDTIATASADMIVDIARQHNVPVITNDPTDVEKGALFGLGADYYTVGLYTGDMAAEVLKGKSPAEFPIKNVVPELLKLNEETLSWLGKPWRLTDEIRELLKLQAEGTGINESIDFADKKYIKNAPSDEELLTAEHFTNLHEYAGRSMKIALINLVQNLALENAIEGVREGLEISGLEEGKDFEIREYCAQGEIGQLSQILGAALQDKPDLVITVTTPAFVAAAGKVKDIPLLYTVASNPYKIKLFDEGELPPNICGIHDDPPVAEVLDMAMKHKEGLKKAGIIYDAAQPNSLLSVEKLRKAGRERNIEILEATASTTSELSMAAQSLLQRGAQVFILSADNLAYTGFPAILKVARSASIPIYSTEKELVEQGATGAIGDDFHHWGVESGKMAAKVLCGLSPEKLGIRPTSKLVIIDPKNLTAGRDQPYKLRIVHYSETEFAERCHEGLVDGIIKAGLVEGQDYELKSYNAQGDMSTLSSIMTTVKADQVDLLLVISTPTLQAALRQAGPETKIVFTGVGDGVKAGAGKSETDHLPNVTGISTRSPFAGMARLISEIMPEAKKVGTLFTPAEINSVLYKDWFKDALAEHGIELVAIPVSSSAEVSQSASELCRHDIQAVTQIVDNLTRPGFALIARRANDNDLPVFAFDSDQMREGACLCLARDYYDAGLEAAEKAIRVLRGENPGDIPFTNTQSEKLIYNEALLEKFELSIPDSFKAKAEKMRD
ncbi:MAG: ABC transporter substrate-binding protein [Bacteroidota bacterium]|nr:ABC transporter substrate-binding protein [Bacteroidota bacterium]